jgi:hypothetical protein
MYNIENCLIYFIFSAKIRVENGELILESAQNKNITFQTMGSGRVNLNGEDLTSILPR